MGCQNVQLNGTVHIQNIFQMCVCVFKYRNDVPRVAQRYGTIAANTRRRASVLDMFVVFCVHMHSFQFDKISIRTCVLAHRQLRTCQCTLFS